MNWYWIVGIVVLIVVVVCFYAIMPSMRKRPEEAEFFWKYYAHRGLHDNKSEAPENSMLAFRKAKEAGYGIELDVQLTKDEQVVVFHDESLFRVCHQEGNVRDYTYEELQDFSLLDSEERIPLFTEVLKEINGEIPLIVEIKIHENVDKVCSKVSPILDAYQGTYVIESFHPFAVSWYKKNRPNVLRGQLSSNLRKDNDGKYQISYFFVQHLLFNFLAKPDFIAYCHTYRKASAFVLSTKLCKAIPVAWTIKSQKELDSCKNSFHSFIFEGFIPK
jgi:glycerophosphoryl diester phosphodiesterase